MRMTEAPSAEAFRPSKPNWVYKKEKVFNGMVQEKQTRGCLYYIIYIIYLVCLYVGMIVYISICLFGSGYSFGYIY